MKGYLMRNIQNLDLAKYVRVYDNRVYAWFGGLGISIYNHDLEEIDIFHLPHVDFRDTVNVKIEIEDHEDELFMSENYTDDIFYSHDLVTGEDLETQNS